MQEAEIYSSLTNIFHDIFGDDTIVLSPDLSADQVADWDSFAHINLIVTIESRFKIKFKTAELESLRNVGQLVKLIGEKFALKEAVA
jgi:acyl carrier protein